MAIALDTAIEQIRATQHDARLNGNLEQTRWPVILLKSPKGRTGPKWVDGVRTSVGTGDRDASVKPVFSEPLTPMAVPLPLHCDP